MRFILFILLFFCLKHSFAQSTFYYNHIKPYSNEPQSLAECEDGYLVTGENPFPGMHANGFLLFLNKKGDILWEKNIIAPDPDKDEEYRAAIFYQECFYVAGFRWINNQRKNILLKIDTQGNILLDKVFGGPYILGRDNYIPYMYANEEGILLAASGFDSVSTSTSAELIQIDLEANILWHKFYSANDTSSLYSDIMTRIDPIENGYLLTMESLYATTYEISNFIIRVDKQGNEIWRKNFTFYQSSSMEQDSILSFQSATTFKSNHMIAHFVITNTSDPSQNIVLIEFDENGNEIDFRKYPKQPGVVFSEINVNQYGEIFILAQQELGSPFYTQLYAVKFNNEKELLWEHNYGVENISELYFCGMLTSDGGILIGGRDLQTVFNTPLFNSILMKTDCRGELEWSYDSCLLPEITEVDIFPNPFSSYINIHIPNIPKENKITIQLYNLMGQLIAESSFFNTNVVHLDTEKYSEGLYHCVILLNDNFLSKAKIVKQ